MQTMTRPRKGTSRTWADRLKQFRIDRKLTQADAAKLFEIPLRTLISWENKQRQPSKASARLLILTFPELDQ